MTWRWLAALVAAASACRIAHASARPPTAQPNVAPTVPIVRFRSGTTAFSTYSGLDESQLAVVRDSIAWTRLWQRIQQPFFPRAHAPPVNFDRDMVIVAAMGRRPSAGYDITIEGAERTPGGVLVDVRVSRPAPGCPVEAVVTQPVDLGRVPATDAPIQFREHQVTIPCDAR